eukprot:5220852-Alexandrium_andersonii.AAC.1
MPSATAWQSVTTSRSRPRRHRTATSAAKSSALKTVQSARGSAPDAVNPSGKASACSAVAWAAQAAPGQ